MLRRCSKTTVRLPVYQDAVFEVPADDADENVALYLSSLPHQVFHGVAVSDVRDVLVDDRSGVEVFGDVVDGGADGPDAPLARPPVTRR